MDGFGETSFDYRTLFESAPTGIFVVDGGKRIVDANIVALDMMRFTRSELIGRECHKFICPKQRGKCPVLDYGEEVCNLETVVIKKDKSRLPVLKSCQKVEITGKSFVIEGFVDITYRKKVQEEKKRLLEQLFHAQKMEAIGILAGGVAHEFRNVLTPIVGYAEFLEEIVNDSQGREYVDIIKESASRGADIASRVLGFSRKTPINIEKVDIREVLENLVTILRSTTSKDISIELSYNTNVRNIHADSSLLEQVFMNLSINACEAMPYGGHLSYEVSLAGPDSCPDIGAPEGKQQRFIRVSVIDTGTGIDDTVKAHAFDPFVSTKGSKGTGLGLFMAYNILQRHGGCITFESKKSRGTTFHIYLPVHGKHLEL